MKKKKWFIILGVGVIVIVFLLSLQSSNSNSHLDKNMMTNPTRGDITVSVSETGLVEPLTKVEIKSKIPGQVAKIHVQEGDLIQAGMVLIELDKAQYGYAVERARTQHEEAKIRYRFYEKKLTRKREEFKSKAISQHVLDETELEKEIAKTTQQRMLVEWKATKDDLEHCQIRSPIKGVVIYRGVEIGEMVTPGIDATVEGKPLLTVADLSQLIVKAELNQIDMAKVQLGQQVGIDFDALPKTSFSGIIHQISPAALPGRNNIFLFPIEILLASSTAMKHIKPGMTADIDIFVAKNKDVLTLPIEAILDEDGQKIVQVVQGNSKNTKIEKRPVIIGLENDRIAEIVEGITEQESVLIKPKSAAENEVTL